jgi:hypothetical protein
VSSIVTKTHEKRITMNSQSTNSSITVELSRCQHHFYSGRRCRMPATSAEIPFCAQHSALHPDDLDSIDICPDLLGSAREINNPTDMQIVLTRILVLLAQNRITTQKAAVMTYIVQQLLRTLPAIEQERKNNPPKVVFDWFDKKTADRPVPLSDSIPGFPAP